MSVKYPPPVLNGQYQAGWSTKQNQMKDTWLFYIVSQVLKVLLIKSYMVQLPVLLFLVVLHQLLHRQIDFLQLFQTLFTTIRKIISVINFPYLIDSPNLPPIPHHPLPPKQPKSTKCDKCFLFMLPNIKLPNISAKTIFLFWGNILAYSYLPLIIQSI